MECYIAHCVAGFIAIDNDENIISYKLFDDSKRISKLIEIESRTITEEEINLIEELYEKYDEISIETRCGKRSYAKWENIKIEFPNKAGNYLRENLEEVLLKINFTDKEDLKKKFSKVYIDLANYKVKEELSSEDKYLIQAINSIDDIDDSISKLVERIRDWYSLYFPELDIIQNNESYIKLISENTSKKDIIEQVQDKFQDYDTENIIEDEISEDDLKILNDYATSIYSLQKTRKNIEKYIKDKMEKLAPNLTDLVGSSLGAKIISHSGGLEKLASYPSSTVQIMGAEKALFRHLKTGANPPKHGLIYQHPKVRTSKWWNRGKIAKKLSLKISLAVRKDVYSKEFDSEINNTFLKEVEKIEKENPFPTKRPKKDKDEGKKKRKKGRK